MQDRSQRSQSLLTQSLPLPSDADISNMLTWTTDQVCTWLESTGLSMFEKNFREHEIMGAILPLMGLAELKDMDIKLVGPRTALLRKLAKLKRAYVNYQRNRPLWSGVEERYNNPCECIADYAYSCCCPDPPDKYALTSSHVRLTHKVYPYGKALRCCSKGTRMHTIDLSLVVDVDSNSQQTCCGGRDFIIIEHENKNDGAMLYLKVGEGPDVLRMVRDAVEEAQAEQRLNPLVNG